MSQRLNIYIYSLMTDKKNGFIASALKFLFFILSLLYRCIVEVVLFLYACGILKSYRAGCKVISIGNITLGGTGKTPLVLTIARYLMASGKKVVILSRGYKSGTDKKSSDEVELFKKRLGTIVVLVGRDRIKTAKEAQAVYKPDVILLDDGFQHWRLKRDIDIITLDVNNPFGNAKIIPRGILREPISSLKRADIIVVTKVGSDGDGISKAEALKNRLNTINRDVSVFVSSYVPSAFLDLESGQEEALSGISDREAALLCGIANPDSFEETVKSLGAKAALRFYFMDHHHYTEMDIRRIVDECKGKGIDTIVTTEKDISRLAPYSLFITHQSGLRLLALKIDTKIKNEELFFGRLHSLFNS